MLRLRIDRFRLLLMPLLVASLLLLAFALAVGAQSGPSITISSDPAEEVGANETITFALVVPSLVPTITEEFSGSIKATWSENAEFVNASEGFQSAADDRSLQWDYANVRLILSQPPEFTLRASSSPGEIVVTATLYITQADNTIFSEVTETTSLLIAPSVVENVVEVSSEVDLSRSSLAISPTDTTTAGSPITITVLISNTGSKPAENVRFVLSDTQKLETLAIADQSATVAARLDGDGFGFRLSEPLPSQQDAEVLLTARMAPDALGLLRIAGIASTDSTAQVISATVFVSAPAFPRLTVALEGPETVTAGEPLQMSLKVTNDGTVAAGSIEVAIGASPSMDLAASGPSVVGTAQEGTLLLIQLAGVAPGETSEVSLTGIAPDSPMSLIVDARVIGDGYESASRLVDSQTISLRPQPVVEPIAAPTVVTPTVAVPTPPPTPPQPPDDGMDTLLTIGIAALLAAVGSAIALLFLLRRNRKHKPAPVLPAVKSGAGQPGPALVPLAPPTPVRSVPGAFIDSVSPVVRWPLGDATTTIGRSPDSTICIDERYMNWETVSKKHAEIRREGDYYVIYDVSNRNGVYVEGQRTVRNLLRPGWRIGVGGVEFIFRDAATEQ